MINQSPMGWRAGQAALREFRAVERARAQAPEALARQELAGLHASFNRHAARLVSELKTKMADLNLSDLEWRRVAQIALRRDYYSALRELADDVGPRLADRLGIAPNDLRHDEGRDEHGDWLWEDGKYGSATDAQPASPTPRARAVRYADTIHDQSGM